MNRQSRTLVLLLVALFLAPSAQAESRDPLLDHFEGEWGLPGTDSTCEKIEATLKFSEDGSRLDVHYPVPVGSDIGRVSDVFEYSVVAVAGNSVRMKLDGETRKDDQGKLVVWDLVRLSADAFCWHRADWEPDHCSAPRIRCDSALDRFERETTEKASEILQSLQDRDFPDSAARFALPEAIPESEHAAEYQRLSNSLRVVIDELGEPTRWLLFEQDQKFVPELVNISIGPSHVLVSQEHGNYFYAFYEVEFAREGKGYFRAAFDREGGIVQMTFSLLREKSERMAEIGELVLRETAHEF